MPPGVYIIAMDKYGTHIEPYLLEIEKWAAKGATEKEIADKLGVSYSTFRKHAAAMPELGAAVKRGKNRARKIIEKALAVGDGNGRAHGKAQAEPATIYMKAGGIARPDQNGTHRGAFERNKKKIYATQTVCGICGKPVEFSYKYPHPLSPCIDHVIPVSKGGHPSDISNLQLAHWTCNRQKSDKITGAGQPRRNSIEIISNRVLPQSMDWKKYRSKN